MFIIEWVEDVKIVDLKGVRLVCYRDEGDFLVELGYLVLIIDIIDFYILLSIIV